MDLHYFVYRAAEKLNHKWPARLSKFGATEQEIRVSEILKFQLDELREFKREDIYSQLGQDKLAYLIDSYKPTNYFVEFGATDGLTLSNTAALEMRFSWDGILAEPGRGWHESLRENRKVNIETKCIWKENERMISFYEQGELSGITTYLDRKVSGEGYLVETLTLGALLNKYHAPNRIGFLSIDTEGSEYEILKDFDFDSHKFNFIACEHNYSYSRVKLRKLLRKNSYIRILPDNSKWDDWYVHQSIAEEILR